MYKVEEFASGGYMKFKASVEVGGQLIFAYGPTQSQALAELRISLRALRDELDIRMEQLRGAE